MNPAAAQELRSCTDNLKTPSSIDHQKSSVIVYVVVSLVCLGHRQCDRGAEDLQFYHPFLLDTATNYWVSVMYLLLTVLPLFRPDKLVEEQLRCRAKTPSYDCFIMPKIRRSGYDDCRMVQRVGWLG